MFDKIKKQMYKDNALGMAYVYWEKDVKSPISSKYCVQRFIVAADENSLKYIRYGNCKIYNDYEIPMILAGLKEAGYKTLNEWKEIEKMCSTVHEKIYKKENVIPFHKVTRE